MFGKVNRSRWALAEDYTSSFFGIACFMELDWFSFGFGLWGSGHGLCAADLRCMHHVYLLITHTTFTHFTIC